MRKLRIDVSTSVTHRDFDLPDDWDDLSEHQRYRIIRDHSERLVAEVVDTYGEVVDVDAADCAPLAVELDETHLWAVAKLNPGQALTVTAPPCVADVVGKEDRPWVIVKFDDFGVRPTFIRNRAFVAAHFTGPFAVELDAAATEIQTNPAGPQVARIVFEPRGTKRKPTWHAIGHELVQAEESRP